MQKADGEEQLCVQGTERLISNESFPVRSRSGSGWGLESRRLLLLRDDDVLLAVPFLFLPDPEKQ